MKEVILNIPTTFETDRLILRSYLPGDGKWFYPMCLKNRHHLMRFESDNIIMEVNTKEQADNILLELAEAWKNGEYFFACAFDKMTNIFVAQIFFKTINPDLPEYEIGYFAEKDHEGQGYVTKAVTAALEFVFGYLKAHRVRAECDDTNIRSIRVADRCGMLMEGHIRENKKDSNGTYCGTMYFGILDNEFNKRALS